ncbi:hypothetical protein TKWG_19130 [Advenella kashmirensis WT001]|uniref:Uncharacterized protein n=1 Tax=Advenella kashmirensis (strain DSM 17095 / LMG 22695 / WT001) TaxID=1036672 RepID=I3UF55_ADVKW|nr:hypothetical protein [Advenella kashmirensis]AFK63643.1 hypothetical protein TKWG_19130 [Advenella kashmirensis WT001]
MEAIVSAMVQSSTAMRCGVFFWLLGGADSVGVAALGGFVWLAAGPVATAFANRQAQISMQR